MTVFLIVIVTPQYDFDRVFRPCGVTHAAVLDAFVMRTAFTLYAAGVGARLRVRMLIFRQRIRDRRASERRVCANNSRVFHT